MVFVVRVGTGHCVEIHNPLEDIVRLSRKQELKLIRFFSNCKQQISRHQMIFKKRLARRYSSSSPRIFSCRRSEHQSNVDSDGEGGPSHSSYGQGIIIQHSVIFCVLNGDGHLEAIKRLSRKKEVQLSKTIRHSDMDGSTMSEDEENFPQEYEEHGIFTLLAKLIWDHEPR